MSLECRHDPPVQKGFIMNKYPSQAGRGDRGRGAGYGPCKGGRFLWEAAIGNFIQPLSFALKISA
jgi:hypothetical protein